MARNGTPGHERLESSTDRPIESCKRSTNETRRPGLIPRNLNESSCSAEFLTSCDATSLRPYPGKASTYILGLITSVPAPVSEPNRGTFRLQWLRFGATTNTM